MLQKDATRHLPRFAFHVKTAQQYLSSRQWMLGLGLDVAGALLMIAAYAMAPVSVPSLGSLAAAGCELPSFK